MKRIIFLLLTAFSFATMMAQDVITKQPEGELQTLYRVSDAYFLLGQYVYRSHVDGGAANIVKAADGTYYMQNPFSTLYTGTWMKMEPDGQGGLRVPVMQPIADDLSTFMEVDDDVSKPAKGVIAALRLNSAGNSFEVDPTAEYLHFEVNDGVISLSNEQIMGLIFAETKDWTGYCDYNTRYEEVKEYKVEVPSDVYDKAEDFLISFNYGQKARNARPVKAAFYDDKVYILIREGRSDLWMCGEIRGDKVVVPALEYFGYFDYDPSGHIFIMPVTYEELIDDGVLYNYYTKDDNDIIFDYDKENRTLKTSQSFLINPSKNQISYMSEYCEMEMRPLKNVIERPENPHIAFFQPYNQTDRWGYVDFQQAPLTENGEYMPLGGMMFNIYFDDEKVTFKPSEYKYLNQEMTDVPLFYQDGDINVIEDPDFVVSGLTQTVFYYRNNVNRIGVQTFFTMNGTKYASDIIYTDGTIVSAIDGHVVSDNQGNDTTDALFDMQGRKVAKSAQGIYLERRNGKVTKRIVR